MRPDCKSLAGKVLAAVLLLSFTYLAYADEMLLFPDVTGALRSNGSDVHKKKELEPTIDFFYSHTGGTLQVLGEFLLSRKENELERMQFGLSSAQGYTAWLGRFHTPVSYWNTTFHHGAYMQPSISRPGIAAYEDHQGILPLHTTGLLVEGSSPVQGRRVNYEFSAGLGPVLKDELAPFNLLSPQGHGKLTTAAKVGVQTDETDVDELGFILAYTEIPILDGSSQRLRQQVAGLFVNQDYKQWRVLAELTFLRVRFDTSAATSPSLFSNAYVHTEYTLNEKWTAYGRVEGSAHADDAYLNLFPDFIKSRALLGMRWSPRHNQALKLELGHSVRQDGHHYQELGAQWSMVFP